jgi:biopolymer transport protein ExbD
MLFRRKRRVQPQLNLTPLIDVVLQLLIFFMLSTTFVTQPGIPIKLPRASSTIKNVARESNVIIITADNTIYINDQKIRDVEELRSLLLELRKKQEEDLIIVKADETVAYGVVVRVMDIAKTSGFNRIAIATRQSP